MTEKARSSQMQAATKLEDMATELAELTREMPRQSDVSELLLSLSAVQATLNGVYTHLADWHRAAVAHVHHGGEGKRSTSDSPASVRAEIALREAAQYGTDATAALARAHAATEVVLWFDEIRISGDR